MAKEYKAFTEEEKKKFRDAYIANVNEINKGLPEGNKIKPNLEKLEQRLNDPKEVKIYKQSKEIKERLDKIEVEKKRLISSYGINERNFLNRTFFYLLKPGNTEEEKTYNNNLYRDYLEKPYDVFQDTVKKVMTFNPSKFFKAVQEDNLADEIDLLDENLDKMKIGFALIGDINNKKDTIDKNGERKSGKIMISDEFNQIYDAPYHGAIMLGTAPKQLDITATDYYFTLPPLEEYIDAVDFSKVKVDIQQKSIRKLEINSDRNVIKAIKKYPELEVGDNFFVNYKAIRVKNGKEVEVDLQNVLKDDKDKDKEYRNDKDVIFIKRSQEEIDILLNPIDKDYLKVINGEITQEEYDDIELKRYLAEVEDFVKNPSKYHKEKEPDFTKPLTEKEKKDFEEHYIENVEMYNKVLPEGNKLTLDLEGLRNKMDDPKQVEIYRRHIFLKEKLKKQEQIYAENSKEMKVSGTNFLGRNMHNLMRTDGSAESNAFNARLVKLYSLHPLDFTHAVLNGLYKSDSTAYKAIIKDDNERTKAFYDNFENTLIAFNEVQLKEMIAKDGNLVEELKNSDAKRLLQTKLDLASGFEMPELNFEMPKMTDEQLALCANNDSPSFKKYHLMAMTQLRANRVEDGKKLVELLDKNKILDEKDPILAYKAIETKDGKEKEIPLVNALSKNDPNIKIIKRTEEEKERILQITNGIRKREEISKISKDPTAKDSLNVHNNAIKRYLDIANNPENNKEQIKYDININAQIGLQCINNAIDLVNKKSDEWFEDKEKFLNFAKQNGFKIEDGQIKQFKQGLESEGLEKINLELFDRIEDMIKPEDAALLRKAVKGNGELFERTHVHVLNEKINEIKNNIPNNFTKKEKEEYIKALDNINAKVVVKTEDGFMENAIDKDSEIINRNAVNSLDKFVDSLNVSEKDKKIFFENIDNSKKLVINFRVEAPEDYEAFANVYEKRPHIEFSEGTKNKIKGLSKIVEETGILDTFVHGESNVKNYGFTTFFNKQEELSKLLKKDTSSFTDEEKKEYSKEVIKKSNELNELEAKYDRVLNYITNNFDLKNISTNENIYSGRPFSIEALTQDEGLLEKWDYQNARAGVILNGLAQLYGACKDTGVTIEEYMNNPEKVAKDFLDKTIKESANSLFLPKEGNSLGKRLARASIYDNDAFEQIRMYEASLTRGFEFMIAVDEDRQKAMQNIQSEAIFTRGLNERIKCGLNYLNMDFFSQPPIPNYNNLINILMFGDEAKDNVLEPCEEFYDQTFKKPFIPNYMDKYKQMAKNPGEAFNNIADMIKDYIKEYKVIYKELEDINKTNDTITYQNAILPEHIVVAGKVILENMLKANNMTIEDIKDPIARENIQNYLDNPTKVTCDMLKDELKIEGDELESYEENIEDALQNYSMTKSYTLNKNFKEMMNKIDPASKEKKISKVLENHQIGFFENLFNTKATKNYRNLVDAIYGLSDPKSKYYGKTEKIALAAQAYLDHKYKNGKTINDLTGEAKQRAMFCENLLKVYKKSFSSEADYVFNNNASVVNTEKTNVQSEKVVENTISNENVIRENEPERESVLGLETDTNIEKGNNKVHKAKEEKVNEKNNEKIRDMNQASK